MDDCVDLRELAAIGMAQEAEVDTALFECALEDLSDAELIQLLSAPIDEYSFEEDEAMARLSFRYRQHLRLRSRTSRLRP